MFFLIILGVVVVVMACFAFWPRKQHFVDRDELDHPHGPLPGDES